MVAGSLQTMSITLTAPLLFSKLMIVLIYVPSVQICRAYVDVRVESGFFLGFWKLCFSTWSSEFSDGVQQRRGLQGEGHR